MDLEDVIKKYSNNLESNKSVNEKIKKTINKKSDKDLLLGDSSEQTKNIISSLLKKTLKNDVDKRSKEKDSNIINKIDENRSKDINNKIREDNIEDNKTKNQKKNDNNDEDIQTTDGDDEINDTDEDEIINISYGFEQEQEFLARNIYASKSVNYVELFYGTNGNSDFESDNFYTTIQSEKESEAINASEAQSTFTSIQYAAVMGTIHDVNSEEKRKFDTWIKFNSSLFKLFESLYAVSGDVNYRPLD